MTGRHADGSESDNTTTQVDKDSLVGQSSRISWSSPLPSEGTTTSVVVGTGPRAARGRGDCNGGVDMHTLIGTHP